jgi:hypothetical protein
LIDLTKNGYRAATMEERERFHAAGNCCVIRVYPHDAKMGERLCPHPRLTNQCMCAYHTGLTSGLSEVERTQIMSSNPTPAPATEKKTNGNGHAKTEKAAKPAKAAKIRPSAAAQDREGRKALKAHVVKREKEKTAKTKTAKPRKPAARDARVYTDEEIKAAKARFVKRWETLPPSAKSWKVGDGWVGSPGYLDAVSKRRAHRAGR